MAMVEFPNGNKYSDDDDPSTGMLNGGHRMRFIQSLIDFVQYGSTLGVGGANKEYTHPDPSQTGISIPAYQHIVKLQSIFDPGAGANQLYLTELDGVTVDPPTNLHVYYIDSPMVIPGVIAPTDDFQYMWVKQYDDLGVQNDGLSFYASGGVWVFANNAGWNDLRNPPYLFGTNGEKKLINTAMGSYYLYTYLLSDTPATVTETIQFDNQTSNRFVILVQQAQEYMKSDISWIKAPPVLGGEPANQVFGVLVGREQTFTMMRCASDIAWETHGEVATILMDGSSSRSGWGNDPSLDEAGLYYRRFTLNERQYLAARSAQDVTHHELLDLMGGPYIHTAAFVHLTDTTRRSFVIRGDAYGLTVGSSIDVAGVNAGSYTILTVQDGTEVTPEMGRDYTGCKIITVAEAVDFINANNDVITKPQTTGQLVRGAKYRITDYAPEYLLNRVDDSKVMYIGDNEPLYVIAAGSSTLEPVAYSDEFKDDIIHYSMYPIWNTGGSRPSYPEYSKGQITYRKDTKNDIHAGFDWRNMKWTRYTTGTTMNTTWSSANCPIDLVVSPEFPLSHAVSRLYIEVTSDFHFSVKNLTTSDTNGWWGMDIVMDTATPTEICEGVRILFNVDTHPIGTTWTLVVEGNYDYSNDWGLLAPYIGSQEFYILHNSRTPGRCCRGVHIEETSRNIIIGHDVIPWVDINEEIIDQVELGVGCHDITLCRTVNTIWIRGSYGSLVVKPVCHHINIGMCADNIYINEWSSTIFIGDNAGGHTIGKNCSGISIDPFVRSLVIPDGTENKYYRQNQKPHTITANTTGWNNPTPSVNYADSNAQQAAIDAGTLLPDTYFTRTDSPESIYYWDGYTALTLSVVQAALPPYYAGLNGENRLYVKDGGAGGAIPVVKMPSSLTPEITSYFNELEIGDIYEIFPIVDTYVVFDGGGGTGGVYRDNVPAGDNGVYIRSYMLAQWQWDGGYWNPIGQLGAMARNTGGTTDGMLSWSQEPSNSGAMTPYALNYNEYQLVNRPRINSAYNTDWATAFSKGKTVTFRIQNLGANRTQAVSMGAMTQGVPFVVFNGDFQYTYTITPADPLTETINGGASYTLQPQEYVVFSQNNSLDGVYSNWEVIGGSKVLTTNNPVDLGAKMDAVQQIASSTMDDKLLIVNSVDGEAWSSTIQNILTGSMNHIAGNVRGARRPFFIENDFLSGASVAACLPWNSATIGTTGSINPITTADAEMIGAVRLASVAVASTGWYLMTSLTSHLLDGDERFEIVFRAPAGSATSIVRAGFGNSITATAPTNGVYMEMLNMVATFRVRTNSANTDAASTFTLTANTWYRLVIDINATSGAGAVVFSLYDRNGNHVANSPRSVNAAIPSITTREVGCGALCHTGTGATALNLLDICYMAMTNGKTNGMNR